MQAIEFQATAHQHIIRVPDDVPDGVALRVLLLFNDTEAGGRKSERVGYQTMNVDEIVIPPRDERYAR